MSGREIPILLQKYYPAQVSFNHLILNTDLRQKDI
jgi:hypothetical protein